MPHVQSLINQDSDVESFNNEEENKKAEDKQAQKKQEEEERKHQEDQSKKSAKDELSESKSAFGRNLKQKVEENYEHDFMELQRRYTHENKASVFPILHEEGKIVEVMPLARKSKDDKDNELNEGKDKENNEWLVLKRNTIKHRNFESMHLSWWQNTYDEEAKVD